MGKTLTARRYSFGEEVGNAISHGVMALTVLGGIAPAAIRSYIRNGVLAAVSTSVFMCSLFLMFLSSALYHSMTVDTRQKQIMQILDHIFIYVAIAGTYTPIALIVVGGWQGIAVASLQWAMVLFGILYKSISKRKIPKISLTIYLVMGWSLLFVAPMFFRNARLGMQLLIFGGGVFYSAGAYFYAKKEKRFFHMVWHFFVNLGAVCHFIGILFFI
ncbi:MAG: hemolysin III family protein [Defluviitaleaceae bacterium]|nr:hemolysin III family protein [Defluviitaleaceae bacterium]MCL2835364.1 hemolysin III family protein [Defluviitaleaceae bacterium]